MHAEMGTTPAPTMYGKRPQSSGGPPNKRSKGNPIITRYPPPPGYRGPAQAQSQTMFQPPGWQPDAGFAFVPAQQPINGYPQLAYGQHVPISNIAQPTPAPAFSYSAPLPSDATFASAQTYFQESYQHSHGGPIPDYSMYNATAPAFSTTPVLTADAQAWQPLPPQRSPRRHHSGQSQCSISTVASDIGFNGNGEYLPNLDMETASIPDFDDDFDSECYNICNPDEINPDFSIGTVEWRAPLQTKRSLPATFREAELELIMSQKPRLTNDDTVSDYYTLDRRAETLLSVRQTDHWNEVKDDLIFREFSRFCSEFLSYAEIHATYRSRIDHEWANNESRSIRSITPCSSRPPSRQCHVRHGHRQLNDEMMDMEYSRQPRAHSRDPSAEPNHHHHHQRQSRHQRPSQSQDRNHSRSTSVASSSRHSTTSTATGGRLTRPKPLPLVRDQTQEDILAALGVTGSPKQVYETPGPAFGPSPAEIAAAAQGRSHSRASSVASSTHSVVSHHSGVSRTQYPPHQQNQNQHHPAPGTFRRAASIEAWQADHQQHNTHHHHHHHHQQQQQLQYQQQYNQHHHRPASRASSHASIPEVDYPEPLPHPATIGKANPHALSPIKDDESGENNTPRASKHIHSAAAGMSTPSSQATPTAASASASASMYASSAPAPMGSFGPIDSSISASSALDHNDTSSFSTPSSFGAIGSGSTRRPLSGEGEGGRGTGRFDTTRKRSYADSVAGGVCGALPTIEDDAEELTPKPKKVLLGVDV